MKKLFFSCIALALFTACSSESAEHETKVMTYNLRYANPSDAPNDWDTRKEAATAFILGESPDLLGVQEALNSQITFLETTLEGYGRIGVGRDNGANEGEFSAIYYSKNRYDVKESNTIWLSETPCEVSLGWDGACRRVMTYAVLHDKTLNRDIAFFNTHFDHVGKVARDSSAILVIETINKVAIKRGIPAIFSGDLNATISDKPIQYLINQDVLSDSREIAKEINGGENSYHNWGKISDTGIIDYIMVSKEFKVKNYTVSEEKFNDIFLSDHNPIVVTLSI